MTHNKKTVKLTWEPKPTLIIGNLFEASDEFDRIKERLYLAEKHVRRQSITKPPRNLRNIHMLCFVDVGYSNIAKLEEYATKGIKVGKKTFYPSVYGIMSLDSEQKRIKDVCDVINLSDRKTVMSNTASTEPPKIQIDLTPDEARRLRHSLSDLLCWWSGFKTGTRTIEEYVSLGVADNGIKAAQILQEKIKSKSGPF